MHGKLIITEPLISSCPMSETSTPSDPAKPVPTEATAADGSATIEVASETSAPSHVGESPALPDSATNEGTETVAPAKPSQRIRIGTQRTSQSSESGQDGSNEGAAPQPAEEKLRPKPVTPVTEKAPEPPPSKYPPPNVRAQLSPELEAELEAALEGQSLDSIIDTSVASAPEDLAPETRLKGVVTSQHGDHLFVDLGNHRQGAIPLKQFGEKEGAGPPEPGTEIEVVVARHNREEGLYELNLTTAAVDVGNWDDVEAGQTVEVTVSGTNKGGLECEVSGIKGFMPMGQISVYRVENAEEYVGQKLAAVITEANRDRRNLVLSHRAVMERERAAKRDQLLAELAPGQVREGVVRSLKDFGAFVDLGGVDGLIHISKMSWDRIGHPKEVLSEGETVKVKIEKIDSDTGKIGLSYREAADNPWEKVDSTFPVGTRVTAKVSKVMDFGAFVKLAPGVEGLIHISELAHGRVHRTSDAVSEGQDVEVKVLSVDKEKQRIALSLKALMEPPVKEGEEKIADEDLPLPADAPKPPKKRQDANLKGGIGGPSGGEQFGLKW